MVPLFFWYITHTHIHWVSNKIYFLFTIFSRYSSFHLLVCTRWTNSRERTKKSFHLFFRLLVGGWVMTWNIGMRILTTNGGERIPLNILNYLKSIPTYERPANNLREGGRRLLVVVSIYDVCEVSDDGGWIGIIAVKG